LQLHPEAQRREIADLALIGDGESAMLVDRAGAVCWACWPRFDSPAIFASLLGDENNGEWSLAPAGPFRSTRRYLGDTLILETRFETEDGAALLTDFMPYQRAPRALVRRLRGLSGRISMRTRCAPRAGSGRSTPRCLKEGDRLRIEWEDFALALQSTRPDLARVEEAATFQISEGETVDFLLTESATSVTEIDSFAAEAEKQCASFWSAWAARCAYAGPWRAAVMRSLITLKALIYAPTGAMAAAPTSSLPEHIGGSRNWDYRYCWLRDSTFTVLAFLHAGYLEEADAWVKWFLGAARAGRGRIQPFYGVTPADMLDETEAEWLSGFADSRPVRFGNAARRQLQLGVYGEAQDALFQWRAANGGRGEVAWPQQVRMLNHLIALIDQPDCGIWEQRGHREFFTQSRALAWAAFDRVGRSAAGMGLSAPSEWAQRASALHEEICRRGWDPELQSFTRAYGSRSLDASCLLIGLVGFLPPDDPRIVGTVEAIRSRLGVGPFVWRYDTDVEQDGKSGDEGAFLACSFWLADNLILRGRRDEGAAIFEEVAASANDVGLLAEEYDVSSRRLLGNFPQALTHLALVHTAFNLTGDGPAHRRAACDY
jgi:GH15 family glucan-1,4-alpha-glucosidase